MTDYQRKLAAGHYRSETATEEPEAPAPEPAPEPEPEPAEEPAEASS